MSDRFAINNDEPEGITSASSVSIWLRNLPDPKNHSYDKDLSPQLPAKRKSREKCEKLRGSPKRQRLVDTSGNSMAPSRRTSPRKAVDSNLPSTFSNPPRRQGRSGKPALPPSTPTSQRAGSSTHPDEESTPRPEYRGTIPKLTSSSAAHILAQPPSPRRSIASSPSRSDTTASSRGGIRSGSPVKRIGDLQLSNTPMEIQDLETYAVPSSVKQLCRDMQLIEAREHVIPQAVKSKVMAHSENSVLRDINFAAEEEHRESSELGLGHESFWERVVEILGAASECHTKGYNEAAWNCEVHSTLLRLALRGHWQSTGVWYRNVTSAKIHDSGLLPTVSGSITQSKMVYFVLLMDSSQYVNKELHDAIIATLHNEGKTSINHTAMYEVRYSPIAVSIETKRANVDEDGADMQLGLWVSAHFARLRQMTGGASPLPALPLITVQGHEWKMMVAEATEDRRIVLLKEITLGKTNSALGVYQIVAALKRLARWINEEYKPWFEENALAL